MNAHGCGNDSYPAGMHGNEDGGWIPLGVVQSGWLASQLIARAAVEQPNLLVFQVETPDGTVVAGSQQLLALEGVEAHAGYGVSVELEFLPRVGVSVPEPYVTVAVSSGYQQPFT